MQFKIVSECVWGAKKKWGKQNLIHVPFFPLLHIKQCENIGLRCDWARVCWLNRLLKLFIFCKKNFSFRKLFSVILWDSELIDKVRIVTKLNSLRFFCQIFQYFNLNGNPTYRSELFEVALDIFQRCGSG